MGKLNTIKEDTLAKCGHELYWHNCYKGAFDVISPSSMAHPAKMAPALCFRILQHLEELGLLKKGQDTILDPMSGTGITNICAGAMGFPSISVELEEKFIGFQKENKEYAERKLYKSLDWTMIKGDSRRLSELLQEQGLKSVVSPPYESSLNNTAEQKGWDKLANDPTSSRYGRKSIPSVGAEYSDDPDNIGNLKDTPLKAITSPPYQDSQGHPSLGSVNKDDWGKEGKDIVKRRGLSGKYGESEGQVGNLKSITSPPYEQSITGGKSGIEWQEEWGKPSESRQPSQDISYGESKENIGNLKDKPLKSIVSPPYGDVEKRDRSIEPHYEKEKDYPRGDKTIGAGYQGSDDNIGELVDKPLKSITSPPYGDGVTADYTLAPTKGSFSDVKLPALNSSYGQTEGQIGVLSDKPLKSVMSPPYDNRLRDEGDDPHRHWGTKKNDKYMIDYGTAEGQIAQEKTESYLEAMKRVYSEIALVSDVLCVVVKNPTRNGRLRRLDLDTIAILEASGWRIHCQHRALLFEELEQADMFGGSKKKVKGRLSFFKRLSYVKGQPVASWEDIIICVRK